MLIALQVYCPLRCAKNNLNFHIKITLSLSLMELKHTNQTYTVASSAPTVTGSVFMKRFRLYLGPCRALGSIRRFIHMPPHWGSLHAVCKCLIRTRDQFLRSLAEHWRNASIFVLNNSHEGLKKYYICQIWWELWRVCNHYLSGIVLLYLSKCTVRKLSWNL